MSVRPGAGELVETLLSGMEQSSAELARAALGWMVPEGGSLGELNQVELQEFLWYQLPTRWMVETSELHEIAWSLGDLLAAAGFERYAGLCRAPETHRLLDAWQQDDHKPARKAMNAAFASSGVVPHDTPLLGWTSVMGTAEHSASRQVSEDLERAIDAGELVPGARGWKQQAARITDASLTLPRIDRHGGTMMQAVCRERAERWAAEPPAARQEGLTPILPLLEGEVAVPAGAAESLTPMRWLLEHIGGGTTLTQAGWLPKALVLKANDTFGWFDLPGFTVRTETDLPQLATLNDLARSTRLITKKGRRVSLSARGRQALGDPSRLWRVVVSGTFAAGTFEGEGAALAGATLLHVGPPVPRKAVEAEVLAGLEGRWRTVEGAPLDEWSGMHATADYRLLGEVFGWLKEEGDWQNRTWTLTPPGRQATLLGLQLQARTPRHRP